MARRDTVPPGHRAWLYRDVDAAPSDEAAARRAVEAVWRIEAGRLVAGLARVTRDVGLAEELAQDALVAALEQWPRTGTPPNPAGWLMTTAKNRAIDAHRRRVVHQQKVEVLGRRCWAGRPRSRTTRSRPRWTTRSTT